MSNYDKTIKLIFIVVLSSFQTGVYAQQCRISNGNVGSCVLLVKCKPLLDINNKEEKTENDILFLRQASCGLTANFKPKVCCPPETEWSTFKQAEPIVFPTSKPTVLSRLPDTDVLEERMIDYGNCPATLEPPKFDTDCCGIQSASSDKIIGGETTAIDEYPWLALLEYAGGFTKCTGSLISSRYVITAAHCCRTRFGQPLKVRLAEFNTSSYPTDVVEVAGEGFDYITVLIRTIEKLIIHPEYRIELRASSQHDIALIKLSKNAPYTDFVRPICLPTSDVTKTVKGSLSFSIAGWGSNGQNENEVKQHLTEVPFVPLDKCMRIHKPKMYNTQICAGGQVGRDSCQGDSGGPLMYEQDNKYILVGVVSYGHIECGSAGKPGVYTNVFKYLDWIYKETAL